MKLRRALVISCVSILFFCSGVEAKAGLFELDIEPIVGYERVQEVLPTRHTTNRLMYGGRLTAGVLLLSLEAEYTHGSSDESYPGFTQTDSDDRIKAGLRSGFRLGPLLTLSLRGGLEASQETTKRTVGSVTTTTTQSVAYNPYAGLSARLRLLRQFSASADVVVIVPSFSDFSQNQYQTTAGFILRLP